MVQINNLKMKERLNIMGGLNNMIRIKNFELSFYSVL